MVFRMRKNNERAQLIDPATGGYQMATIVCYSEDKIIKKIKTELMCLHELVKVLTLFIAKIEDIHKSV